LVPWFKVNDIIMKAVILNGCGFLLTSSNIKDTTTSTYFTIYFAKFSLLKNTESYDIHEYMREQRTVEVRGSASSAGLSWARLGQSTPLEESPAAGNKDLTVEVTRWLILVNNFI
jgi:hypothetical protein